MLRGLSNSRSLRIYGGAVMNEFGFIEQRWPWALVVTLVLAASLIYLERLRLQRLTQLLKTVRSRIRPSVFIALIIIFILAFAVARPYFGYEDITIKTSGSDTILVVDVSQSMLTRDVQPSRLELAKRKVLDIVERVSTVRNGDRLGLVLFAGASYLYCPLTSDYSALGEFARAISTELVTAPGSAVNLAVATALQAFENATASTTPRS